MPTSDFVYLFVFISPFLQTAHAEEVTFNEDYDMETTYEERDEYDEKAVEDFIKQIKDINNKIDSVFRSTVRRGYKDTIDYIIEFVDKVQALLALTGGCITKLCSTESEPNRPIPVRYKTYRRYMIIAYSPHLIDLARKGELTSEIVDQFTSRKKGRHLNGGKRRTNPPPPPPKKKVADYKQEVAELKQDVQRLY